ncbi:MAG TPA: aldehyde dehydrogenase (NADP(+)) [Noviherbaspirillum sp.]
MQITGENLIGATRLMGQGMPFRAWNPTEGCEIEPVFYSADQAEVGQACALAEAAFETYRNTTPAQRASLLEAIAENLAALGDTLIERAAMETGLPVARLQGERARTINQLKMFANLVLEGSWIDARVETAQPDRQPLPRPDLRMQSIPLGPVAVFGASNFPLAFSVAGGDTASALAAGCPVIVKAHPAHPGTSELAGRAIQAAVEQCRLPAGVFSLLTGTGNELGAALVSHPAIQAVGFTGSRQGGLALMALAAKRRQPIPVYAEMSSINPVFLFPAALAQRGADIARGFADSLTMGAGQFCTNPGIVFGISGDAFERFCAEAAKHISAKPAVTMLTRGIHEAYERGVGKLASHAQLALLSQGGAGGHCMGTPALFRTTAKRFTAARELSEEVFGASSILIECSDLREMLDVVHHLEGQLTATMQIDAADYDSAKRLLPILERKVGRILVNGFPTGAEVSPAMVHGGPFPATSDGRSTSVGTAAIFRFVRPVCYQDMPQALLPNALRDGNPTNIWHRRNGELVR